MCAEPLRCSPPEPASPEPRPGDPVPHALLPADEGARAEERGPAESGTVGVEHLYRAVLEQVAAAILVVEPRTGTVVFANGEAATLLEAPVRATVGRSLASLFPEEVAPRIPGLLAEASERGRAVSVLEISRTGATPRTIEIAAKLVRWSRGPAVLATLRDATESLRREEELARTRSLLEAMLRALPGFVLRIDRSGAILDYRGSEQAADPVPGAALFGASLAEVLPPSTLAEVDAALALAATSGAVERTDFASRGENGAETWLEASFVPLDRGECAVVLRDATERRCLELDLDRLRGRLAVLAGRFAELGVRETTAAT